MPSPECKSVHELLVDSRQEASDLAADIVRITSKWVLLNQFIDAHLALVCPARSPQTTLCGKYSQPRFHREIRPSADWKPFCSAIYLMNGGCSDFGPLVCGPRLAAVLYRLRHRFTRRLSCPDQIALTTCHKLAIDAENISSAKAAETTY
ncbi:hypothetical protein B0H14DRAFT_1383677 [Mycena olivaceomarginata]|nr:hypothetical protein B0H14DRAFT_1383677 [Mycena olivaceomarginata]